MNHNKLIENIVDQIKEAQIKLGYVRETVRLYYPVESLNRLLKTEAKNAGELLGLLEKDQAFSNTVLGELRFAAHEGRIEIRIPPQGADYVHREVPEPKFLMELIRFFGTHHHCSLEDVRRIFAKFSEAYVCERMPEDAGFDYVLYFPDGIVDGYCYCIKEEMEHTIYHRFTKEDFYALTLAE